MKIGDEHWKALGLGLSGAHRTGKTTMAEKLAEANGCPFVASSATQVAKDMGIRADIGMPMEVRLDFQEEVLRRFTRRYAEEGGNGLFVTDRTPLDFAAYALTDWHPERSTPELDDRLSAYVAECMRVTSQYFYMVAVVQPGIRFEARDDKPAPNELYQELLNTTLIGLGMDSQVRSHFCLVPRDCTDLVERVNLVAQRYADKWSQYREFLHEYLPAA